MWTAQQVEELLAPQIKKLGLEWAVTVQVDGQERLIGTFVSGEKKSVIRGNVSGLMGEVAASWNVGAPIVVHKVKLSPPWTEADQELDELWRQGIGDLLGETPVVEVESPFAVTLDEPVPDEEPLSAQPENWDTGDLQLKLSDPYPRPRFDD